MNPIYERLFDYYAIPLLGQDHSQLQSLLAPLPLSEIQRIDLADTLESLRLQWSTDASPWASTWVCHCSTTMSAAVAPRRSSNAWGSTSTWAPTFPAETQMVSNSTAVSWNTVGNCFFIPTGLHPPWT